MLISLALLLKVTSTGLAGALGAHARYTIARLSQQHLSSRFPWGTLLINLTGSLIIGLLSAYLGRHQQLDQWRAPLLLGFLGGYTTFSTLMLEVAQLRARARHGILVAYLAGSALLGPLAAFLGLLIGGRL